jgi:hypothetical protein
LKDAKERREERNCEKEQKGNSGIDRNGNRKQQQLQDCGKQQQQQSHNCRKAAAAIAKRQQESSSSSGTAERSSMCKTPGKRQALQNCRKVQHNYKTAGGKQQ